MTFKDPFLLKRFYDSIVFVVFAKQENANGKCLYPTCFLDARVLVEVTQNDVDHCILLLLCCAIQAYIS